MIAAWLLKSAFGVPRWMLVLGGFLLLLIAGLIYLKRVENLDDQRNQEIGATVEREKNLEKTIERVEEANEVRNEVSAEAAVGRGERLYAQCLRSARTPASCERFLPERPAD